MVRQHHQLNEHESEQTLEKTRKPGMHQFMGSQGRTGHDLVTEQQQYRILVSGSKPIFK